MYSDHNVHVGVKVSKIRAQFNTVPIGGVHSMGSQLHKVRVYNDVNLCFQHKHLGDSEECRMTFKVQQRRPRSYSVRMDSLFTRRR